jgi:hypothetical protein
MITKKNTTSTPSSTPHLLTPPQLPIGLNPIRFAYSISSALVNLSPPFQLAELVRARNLPLRTLKSSSMLSGLMGPKISSGFLIDWASRAARKSGDSAH